MPDAAAEVFPTAWRRLDALPEGDAVRVWTYRIAYRDLGATHDLVAPADARPLRRSR
jgi:hypothetical protein